MSKFEELGLLPEIMQGIQALGFEEPTAIQERAIPAILGSEKDLVALAQTGTGKTAAFGLPLIHMTDTSTSAVQALVLCPTRELAIQIARDLESFGNYLPRLRIQAVYGGTPIVHQIRSLKRGAHIVVGTPGRVLDLIRRQILDLSNIEWVVLDEADEMLNMGFQKDLDAILSETPEGKQTFLFSATMAPPVARIARKYMTEPGEIAVGTKNSTAKDVDHAYYMVHARDRYRALTRIIALELNFFGIVFCRTRRDTKDIARKLNQDGFSADALNGDLSQIQRDEVMYRFRNREIQILVATDVAARGLDVNDLTHVINFELPDDPEVYVHRSGRTGRAGKSGVSLSLIHTREGYKIRTIERMAGKVFERKMVPSGLEICERHLFDYVDRAGAFAPDMESIQEFLPTLYEKLQDLSKEELIQRFISLEFSRMLQVYQDAPDLNVKVQSRQNGRSDRSNRRAVPFTEYQINLGSQHNINPSRLLGIINQQVGNRNMRIGRIKVMGKRSFFEVEQQFAKEVEKSFDSLVFEGMMLRIKPSGKQQEKGQKSRKKTALVQENVSKNGKEKKGRRRKRKRK